RGDAADAARAPHQHVLQRRLGYEEGAGQVDGDDADPVLVTHLGHGLVDGDPGVVDQDVQAAVLLDDFAHHAPAVFRHADVSVVDGDRARVLGVHVFRELLGRLVLPPVTGGDVRALLGQAVAYGGPDAAGPPSDQGHPVLQP